MKHVSHLKVLFRVYSIFYIPALILLIPFCSLCEGKTAESRMPGSKKAQNSTPAGVSSNWWMQASAYIRHSEYNVTWQKKTVLQDISCAWQAPNRAHGFRTYFNEKGFRIVPRTGDTHAWEWGLDLTGYGIGDVIKKVSAGNIVVKGNRVEIDRGNIVEWYINDKRGLEQGFTLEKPPAKGSSGNKQVVLALSLTGTLIPNLTHEGDSQVIELITAEGVRVMRFGGLIAFDATGKNLQSEMQLLKQGKTQYAVNLQVNTKDAVYPVTIDPLATSADWTAEGNQAGAYFGYSVGTAGDVNGDEFSDVIVGAKHYDNGEENEGRAFVFHGSASGLSADADWTAEGDQANAYFGCSVGTAGDVNGDGFGDVIVGADGYDNGEENEGRAFVFHGSASGLSANAEWTAEGDQVDAFFGHSVATAGDVNGDGFSDVIVGAYFYDNGENNEGRAFVFHGSASGLSADADWTAEGDQADARFGISVSTAGDVNGDGFSDVIIGAYRYDNGEENEGRAFVYHGSASGLSADADWTAEGDQADTWFGHSVGTAGDVNGDGYSDVIVGADYYDNGEGKEGRAFVFHGSASGLSADADWTAESDQAEAYFGASAGTAGDVNGDGYSDVIVGADGYDNGEENEGRAFVFHGSASGLSANADWTAEGDQINAYFGWSVGTAGDVNGDGFSDVIVGAFGYDNGENNEGRAFVFHGSGGGLNINISWSSEADKEGAKYGCSVSTAGDVNGDGFSDVIIGACEYDCGLGNEGRVFVFHGSASGLSAEADWTAEGDQADASFGYSAGAAGDVNGDGFSDVIVGAHGYDNDEENEGRAFVFHGSASGLSADADWTAEGDQANAWFGHSVGTAGDVNGNGFSDVIVGASWYDHGEEDEGRAFVFHGSASGLSADADWTAESGQASACFGFSVGTAGDVNGDGFSDVIVGAYWYDSGEENEGRAFVFHGSASGLSADADWTAESDQVNAYFGWSVATAGDVNGDGYSDVVISAVFYDFLFWSDVGAAFVYFGSQAGLSDAVDTYTIGPQAGCNFGWSVGTAGDVNGDGFSDVIVGAPEYDTPLNDAGRAYVYYGNKSKGLSVCPRQFMTDMSTPLSLLGEVDSETDVIIRLTGRMPLGREQVKLQWQAAPLGCAFSSAAVVSGISAEWIDTGIDGTNIFERITGLIRDIAYHWRARLVYQPGNRLGQHAGRWIGFGPNGWLETDFRTSPDATSPTVSITSSAGNPTHVSSIPVTVQFSESVTGFEASDVNLSNATLQDFSGSGASYTFMLTPASPGTVTADISANAAHDAHGNGNMAAAQFSRKYRCCELDFDGDGKADLAVFFKATGWWYFLLSSTGAMDYEKLGEPGYTTVPGDYDGDAKTDVAVYNDITGWWYYILSSTGSLGYNKLGESGYIPMQGDYDGDGKTDLAVYHEASGFWYVINSSSGSLSYTKFGEPNYEAVHGDYDADGKTDLAVFYTPTGWWYYLPSSTGVFSYEKLGESGYTPVPGDYDGDGQTDMAVFYETSGWWYFLFSSTGALGYNKLGEPGYTPVPADYDGDGKTDLTVYHEASGYWYIIYSSDWTLSYQKFGEPGYTPVK